MQTADTGEFHIYAYCMKVNGICMVPEHDHRAKATWFKIDLFSAYAPVKVQTKTHALASFRGPVTVSMTTVDQ